jgi:hypothetical protein
VDFLRERSAEFAQEIQDTLVRVLPGALQMVSVAFESRYIVRPEGAATAQQRIPLYVGGEHLAGLGIQMYLGLDSSGKFLKVWKSNLAVHSVLDRTPLVRQEFDATMTTAPMAHWHMHADRGALSHLLGRAHAIRADVVRKPHDLSSLHIPVGGERFRPCLEDLLEFLIRECGIDHVEGWEQSVLEGRETWRRRQFRSTVRDLQGEAAQVLTAHGWHVTPPDAVPVEGQGVLYRW